MVEVGMVVMVRRGFVVVFVVVIGEGEGEERI